MADKLIVALVNADPRNLLQISLPILQATVAATMEYNVEVIFSGQAGQVAMKSFALEVKQVQTEEKNIYDIIKEAYDAGVVFKICTPALDAWGDDIIPEINEIVGGTYLISEAMDEDTVTFTY